MSALIVVASVAVIATSTGAAAHPSAADSSGKIAYSNRIFDRHGDAYRIVVMNANGRSHRVLPLAPGHSSWPAWSPDSAKIAFVASDWAGLQPEIWIMNASGPGNLRRLTGKGEEPAWSPDGQTIAFSRDGDLYVMGADGSGQRRLLPNATSPTWSPDGSSIAFVRAARGCSGAARNRERCMRSFDIYVANPDGAGLRRLTRNRLWEYNPDWSPTGSQIAFDRAGSVFVINSDGRGQRRIAREGGDPSWSPDATKIVYFGIHAFRTMNPDGSAKRQLFPPVYSCPECGQPDWSAG